MIAYRNNAGESVTLLINERLRNSLVITESATGIEIIGTVEDEAEAAETIANERPDLVRTTK